MQFMYVDESGDPGALKPGVAAHLQPSAHFIVCGVVISSRNWQQQLDSLVLARNSVLDPLGIPRRIELHAREILHPSISSPFRRLRNKKSRIDLYRQLLRGIDHALPEMRIIAVCVCKPLNEATTQQMHRSVFDHAWTGLIGRFDALLSTSVAPTTGMILADETDESRLRSLVRRMRRLGQPSNPEICAKHRVPSAEGRATRGLHWIVEDAVLRQSQHSYFVQIADLAAYALYLREWPRGSLRRYGGDRLFELLEHKLIHLEIARES